MTDRLSVDPDAVAKDSAGIGELAEEMRAIQRWHEDSTEALGRCWGEGDAVAKSFEENYVPARDQFSDFLTAMTTALEKTEEGLLDTAQQYALDEQYGLDNALRLTGGQDSGDAGGRH